MPDEYDIFAGSVDEMAELEITIFKRVFQSEDGQYVLGRILEKCKFMEQCENERDMALNNFAKELMAIVYHDREKKGVNIHRIIEFIRLKLKRRK